MKYLVIKLDNKFKFTDHIHYAAECCTKLIHSLAKSAKISWGLTHGELKLYTKAHYYHSYYTGRLSGEKP
jgi:hypothetical protein